MSDVLWFLIYSPKLGQYLAEDLRYSPPIKWTKEPFAAMKYAYPIQADVSIKQLPTDLEAKVVLWDLLYLWDVERIRVERGYDSESKT